MHGKIIILIASICAICAANTTSVRIYQQVGNASSYQNKQIGIDTVPDAVLGWRMWSGKDAVGGVTKWLAKDKPARVDSLESTTGARLNRVYIDSIRTLNYLTTGTADSMRIRGLSYGIARGDTIKSYKDTSLIKVADSLYSRTIKIGSLTGASKLSADTISAVHLLNLRKHSGAHFSGDGDLYYDSAHSNIEFFTNGTSGTVNRCIWAQSNVMTDSGSAAETSLKGTDSVLLVDFPSILDSLPTNFFRPGKRLRYGISGFYQTKATSAGTMIIRLKMNNTIIDSVVSTLDNNEVEQVWRMDGAVVCASAGVSGVVRTVTSWNHGVSGIMHCDPLVGQSVTLNTTIRQRFNLTFQFSDATFATRANMIKSIIFYLEEIH